jgi:hypothetical protein
MPAKPQWWTKLPEILKTIESLETAWIDRPMIEKIFAVRRRRAIELLNQFGGFQTGRTFLIERDALLETLRAIHTGQDYHWDRKRRRRLSDALSTARQFSQAARIRIQVELPSPGLPAGVILEPGRMTIDFRGVHDLLTKLYSISRAAAQDFEAFQQAAGQQ